MTKRPLIKADVTLPKLGTVGWLRWAWRQLTSMRVALILLLLLALAAVPGTVLPQRPQNPGAVARYLEANPRIGPLLDRLGFFNVFASAWFSAIYLLLFISLAGCILPRLRLHIRNLRGTPGRLPTRLSRFESYRSVESERDVDAVLDPAHNWASARRWGIRRYRVARHPNGISAQRGYLRESGNVMFHLSLLGLLGAMGTGYFLHYRAQEVIVAGQTVVNSAASFDSLEHGPAFNPASLTPFTVRLDTFESTFTATGDARDFTANLSLTQPGGSTQHKQLRVNQTVTAAGVQLSLQGNGYAPTVEIRDATGKLAFSGATPFLPQDAMYTSTGVIKVPDTDGGEQLGLQGWFFPAANDDGVRVTSVHPQALHPLLVLAVWTGDLGLNLGQPQNVYELNYADMKRVEQDGKPLTLQLEPGQSAQIPGHGTVTFTGVKRFIAIDLQFDPTKEWVLVFALLALAGLAASLFVPQRQLWLRVEVHDGRTVLHAAGLAGRSDAGLAQDVTGILAAASGQSNLQEDE